MHSDIFEKIKLISFFVDYNLLVNHRVFIIRNFMENSEISIHIFIEKLNEGFKYLKKYPL